MANYTFHKDRALMYRDQARMYRRNGFLSQAHARYIMGLSNIKMARKACNRDAPLYTSKLIKKERKV